MIAVDTNVVVRLIVADDDAQVEAALALAARELLHVGIGVLMETDWVLRSRYGFTRRQAHAALANLFLVDFLRFEASEDVRWALARYAEGGEFADFLHIAAARPVGRFATFEHRLAQRAGRDSPVSIETLA